MDLKRLKQRAKRQGWANWIKNDTDEQALLEGCWFDKKAAGHVCGFFEECLVHSKGDHRGEPFRLLDWQRDFLSRLMGWKRKDGTRRFRQAGVWVPKKNGKSTLCAGIVLYLLLADGEPSAEVYSVAKSAEQSMIVFREAKAMALASPELKRLYERKYLDIIQSTRRIVVPSTNSFYAALSGNAATAEGINLHGCIFDEIHRQRNDDLFDSLRYGGAARRQPLLITISTAGVFDPTNIAYKQFKFAHDVQDGIVKDTSFLPIIFAADPEDDWTTDNKRCVEVWKKSNPSLGHTIRIDDFRRDVEEAMQAPSKQASFKRRRLNLWTEAAQTWVPDDRWMACQGTCQPEIAQDIEWFGGLDLSSTRDVSGLSLVGHYDGKTYVQLYTWINEEQAGVRQKRDQVHYRMWCEQGYMNMIPGNTVDYDIIRRDINDICEQYNVKQIAVDRWNATQLVQQLDGDGIDVMFHGMGFKDMSQPVRELEKLIYDKTLVHDGNPVLRWMMRNVYLETDANGNVRPSKRRSLEKIDGVVAMLLALSISMYEEPGSVYDERPIIYV